ncbi:MAG: twin-arginine translocation signal domain-containing protein [Castellaniella sp.]|uniref:multicopper oxidase family protein n=1 Tax=Castellaniella sp. TaxID=1955812 RepID=UPI0011F5EC88|nr:multicopper oxidase domain-containing protein [Castellaniella sp.]TAN28271.1 MAG: twin-arginine translocation signal domain-containing protein [Castellaniella sp.]
MKRSGHFGRRDFLGASGLAAASLMTGLPLAQTWAKSSHGSADGTFEPDLALELTAHPQNVGLRPGSATAAWSYDARVLKGDAASVRAHPGSTLGPTLYMRRGQNVRIDFVNELDQPSIVNWHGLHVPADMMGLPRYEVAPGKRYRYAFQVNDRAGTYWYHAMAAGHTPEQVYFGLAGLLIVSDDEEAALPLPRGEYDIPIVLQDRTWGQDNQLHYLPGTGPVASRKPQAGDGSTSRGGMMGGHGMMGGTMSGDMGSMMTRMMGFFGDSIFVNGRPAQSLELTAHAYRLRILNASNARTYKLAWKDSRPLTVIATDGGLLREPVHKPYVMLTPGQRVELWADFNGDAVGSDLTLMSESFSSMMNMGDMMSGSGLMGMMGGMMGGGDRMGTSSLPDGAAFPILTIRIAHKVGNDLRFPTHLSTFERLRAQDAANPHNPRSFRVTMGHMQWGFNGRSFKMGAVASDEIVRLGTTEVWEFINSPMMAHAIHLHGLQFQVLERTGSPRSAGVADGYVDEGWLDTVLVMPGERVKLIMRFADFTGLYAYQCHMLEHAAAGLMRDYEVKASHLST